jgi:hypothetical protein
MAEAARDPFVGATLVNNASIFCNSFHSHNDGDIDPVPRVRRDRAVIEP